MPDFATLAGLLALAAAAGLSVQQWRAQPAVPGFLATATRVVANPSTRTTVALAAAAGMIGAQWGAARLVEGIAWLAGITGLDAAAWAPAGADTVFLAVLAACVVDVVVVGLCRVDPARLKAVLRRLRLPELLTPALRHSLVGLALPAVLVAGTPLLGQTITDAAGAIGGAPEPAACAPAGLAGEDTVAGYGPEQLAHAATIVQVGQEMGIPPRGQVIALATAMQESTLWNLNRGDRDSLGLFQQRPSQGWGTPAQVRDPRYAARKFYDRLQGVRRWDGLPLWQAAQAVQRSAYPTAYAKHETAAAQVLGAVRGTTCTTETRS
jgi:hypothetical protein